MTIPVRFRVPSAVQRLLACLAAVAISLCAAAWASGAAVGLKSQLREGNDDLKKVSSTLLRARLLSRAGVSEERIRGRFPVLAFRDGQPEIEVRLRQLTLAIVDRLERIGMRITGVHYRYARVVGTCAPELLDEVAAIPQVTTVHPNYGARAWAGTVTGQGDGSLRADDVRADFGLDGAGVQVGILTDSFNATTAVGGTISGAGCSRTLTGAVQQASGDLPPAVVVLDNCDSGGSNCSIGTDEGAAMAEVIHDIVPGSDLLFHSAFNSEADFAQGITELRVCGADVIVDDVLWYAEPMFQDGIVAQALQGAVDAGVSYFSAAGNEATFSVDEIFVDADPGTDDDTIPPSGADLHDFGSDNRFAMITIPEGCGVLLVLQWNQPFSGVLGPGASSDLDLYLCSTDGLGQNPDGSLFACDDNGALAVGDDSQSCGGTEPPDGDPLEILSYVNTDGAPVEAYVAVEHYCGEDTDLRFRIASFALNCDLTDSGYAFEGPGIFDKSSIYGHAAAAGSSTVGSVFYGEVDTGGNVELPLGAIDVNPSSAGGGFLPFYFDGVGAPLAGAPVERFKPQVVAPEGVNNTFFGLDIAYDADAFPNFLGTSASVAHAAGLAALILELDPSLDAHGVRNLLESTALDIELPGVDPLSGAGLIRAYEAIQARACGQVGATLAVQRGATDSDAVITWDPGLGGPFVVYRGFYEAPPFAYNHASLGDPVFGGIATDSELPPPGRLSYYLVSRLSGLCESSLGQDGSGQTRPNDNPYPSTPVDGDGDGVLDVLDNCLSLFNPDQTDFDLDGIGDPCDNDRDGDGVDDEYDNCLWIPNPAQTDSDGDDLGDDGVIVEFDSTMRFKANAVAPPFGPEWIERTFDDSAWPSGRYGVGFEGSPPGASALLRTIVPNDSLSVYTRLTFDVADPAAVLGVYLGVDHDDAFVAWINGQEILRSDNILPEFPPWNVSLTHPGESSNGAVPDYTPYSDVSSTALPALQLGPNVLAIAVWNFDATSSDLVLVPRMVVHEAGACDNCPFTANPDHLDADGDGLGDACDPCQGNPDPSCVACMPGADPDGDGVCQAEQVLVEQGSAMHYLANQSDPSLGVDWTAADFTVDPNWQPGIFGVGYDTLGAAAGLLDTVVPTNTLSIYTRTEFEIADVSALERVVLGADYDDGHVAWINGVEVYRSPEMPPTGDPAWDVIPSPEHESSNAAQPDYGPLNDVGGASLLQDGTNVLAIGVWNAGLGSSDLVLVPRLSVTTLSADNCPNVPNPDQQDTDGDGLGDACETE